MSKINKIYLASPFFNEKEIQLIDKIKSLLDSLKIEWFSPKDFLMYDKAIEGSAKKCFDGNIKAMNECDYMIAIVDGFDPGTLFEMGYFAGKKIIAFSNIKGRKLNVMLAQASYCFANGINDLADKVVRINSNSFEKEEFKGEQE